MKAPDIVEWWLWQDPGQIIERLLSLSSRTIGVAVNAPARHPNRDRYYTRARRLKIKLAMRRAKRGAR